WLRSEQALSGDLLKGKALPSIAV
ncbi:MAG: LysR family transcriptional regulator, partial [Pseudomonas sp.]